MMLTAPRPVLDAPVNHQPPHRFSVHQTKFAGPLILSGWNYLWNLSASGWANSFYSAAVQAGSENWIAPPRRWPR